MSEPKPDDGQSESKAYETRDIKVRPLAAFIAGFAVLTIFSFLVVLGVFRLFSAQHAAQDAQSAAGSLQRPAGPPPADEQLRWPEPRVQSAPADDFKAFRAGEDAVLTTYGWVDRGRGTVRVPIDVAMELVLKEGLPVRQPVTAPPASGTPAPAAAAPRGAQKTQKP